MITLFNCVTRIVAMSALTAFVGSAIAQQAYPNKPIRLIIPTTAGGSTDILARLIGQKLAESWGQQVLVDNRPGGNGTIGGEALVKSPPDGHTIMQISTTHIITPLLAPTPYDAIKDFAPVAGNASSELVLVLHPSVPTNNLQAFISLAKSRPGKFNNATTGVGSLAHLAGALFGIMVEAKIEQIPYKSGGPAIVDLVGGQVEMYFAVPISIMPHIKSGKVKPIAVTGKTRLSAVPQVPTFAEAGLPGFDVRYWYGTLAPAGTPKGIIDKLSAEITRILALPEMKERMVSQGMEVFIATPDELTALMKVETAKYAKIIKAANIKGDN